MNYSDYYSKPISKVGRAFEEMLNNREIEFEIHIVNTPGNLLAFVTIIMWPIVMKGFRVMESSKPDSRGEYIHLVPPALPSRVHQNSYTTVFNIWNRNLWFNLEKVILEKFNRLKNQVTQNENLSDKELDEISKAIERDK